MRPYYKETIAEDPELINGEVRVHKAIRTYYKAFCDSGLMASCFDDKAWWTAIAKNGICCC